MGLGLASEFRFVVILGLGLGLGSRGSNAIIVSVVGDSGSGLCLLPEGYLGFRCVQDKFFRCLCVSAVVFCTVHDVIFERPSERAD